MLFLEDLFEMGSGYVLNFSDRTFSEFFSSELNINIDDPIYSQNGGSKGKRLRAFLRTADKLTLVRTLQALWDYREAVRMRAKVENQVPNARERLTELVSQLGGSKKQNTSTAQSDTVDSETVKQLSAELIALSGLQPQPRGYAFEKFLKNVFDAYGMKGREPFRLVGEQIDGSFILGDETYLLEAKWQGNLTGASDLHAFHGKLDGKAAWARGLFISQSGFSEDGLVAFGKGKRVICMDGLDLYEALNRMIPLNKVLALKVRRAAETGFPFLRVRDLFP
ncbi:MAG: restriction endonuclease [Alphaproteobacteria bacterium]